MMATQASFERQLWALRDAGWAVAIHNDYWVNGARRTFWLFTHRSGKWIKGEGNSDMDALMECDAQSRDLQPDALMAAARALHNILQSVPGSENWDEVNTALNAARNAGIDLTIQPTREST